jgi:hypothetical protein
MGVTRMATMNFENRDNRDNLDAQASMQSLHALKIPLKSQLDALAEAT